MTQTGDKRMRWRELLPLWPLLFLLPAMAWLQSAGVTDLSVFGVAPLWPSARGAWLIGLCGAGAVVHGVCPDRHKGWVRLSLGFMGGIVAYPLMMVPLLLLALAVWAIIHHVGRGIGVKLWALGALHLCLGAAVWGLPRLVHGGAWADEAPRQLAQVFVALMFFKSLQYLVEGARDRWAPRPLLGWLEYQFSLPAFLIHPYLLVIPSSLAPRQQRPWEHLYRDGVRSIAMGLGTLLIARLLFYGLGRISPYPPDTIFAWHLWSLGDMGVILTWAAAHAALLIGLLRCLGVEVKDASRHPWFASGLFDYWGRFIIHYKDLQVALIYLPTVLRNRGRGTVQTVLIGSATTFLIGNNVMHLLGRYLYGPELFTRMPHAALQNLALAAVMGSALWWRERPGATAERAPGPLGRGLRTYITLSVVAWIWHL